MLKSIFFSAHLEAYVLYKTLLDEHTLNVISYVLFGFLFDMQISLRLKIQSFSVSRASFENFTLLVEVECSAVWKMVVSALYNKMRMCVFNTC